MAAVRLLGLISIPLLLVALGILYGLNLLPPEVYGALLGSLLTLFGLQLKSRYDSELKQIELRHTLRRDVYLQVAEGIDASARYLSQLVKPDIDPPQDPPGVPPGWLQKLEIIASPATIQLARAAGRVYVDVILDLMKRRLKLQKLDYDIKATADERSYKQELQHKSRGEWIEAVAEPASSLRDAKLQSLTTLQAELQQQIERLDAHHDRLHDERAKEYRELARSMIRGSHRYVREVRQLQNAIRCELNNNLVEAGADVPSARGELPTETQIDEVLDYVEELWNEPRGDNTPVNGPTQDNL